MPQLGKKKGNEVVYSTKNYITIVEQIQGGLKGSKVGSNNNLP
jgi:hypothetical protein